MNFIYFSREKQRGGFIKEERPENSEYLYLSEIRLEERTDCSNNFHLFTVLFPGFSNLITKKCGIIEMSRQFCALQVSARKCALITKRL